MKVRHRALVVVMAALVAPHIVTAGTSESQKRKTGDVRRVGVLGYGVDPALMEALRAELARLGYVEGRDIAFEYRCSEARIEDLPTRAAELIRLKVDVIVAVGTPSVRAAMAATNSIPVVMVSIGNDPVRLGLVRSLSRPGGNVTGLAALGPELWGKRLQLFREAVPRLSVVAVLSNPSNPSNVISYEEIQLAAKNAGIMAKNFPASDPGALERGLVEIAKGRFDGLICIWDSLLLSRAHEIASFALQHRLPTIAAVRQYVEAGILMSYGARLPEQWRRAGHYVDRILKGTTPADLPVEQPMAFELVINGKTARALGVEFRPELLVQAEKVIE
jgi:putative ABC transport system substrate-binding protein